MKSYTLKELVLMRDEVSDRIKAANLLPLDETNAALAVEKMTFYCESDVAGLVGAMELISRILNSHELSDHSSRGLAQDAVGEAIAKIRGDT